MDVRLKVSLLSTLFLLILWSSSCRKEFEYASSNGHLSFSKDTVYLDTIFSTIGSSTYSLKVYNDTKDDVVIPSIKLRNGSESYYRLNVDGRGGNNFQDVPLYAQDSLFIFIETTVDLSTRPENVMLYTDAIQFDNEFFLQEVELVTLVKDAKFLYPTLDHQGNKTTIKLYTQNDGTEVWVDGFDLTDSQLSFTKEKPYVIYGYASVPEGKQLTIEAGSRLHFHENSGLFIQKGASININGTYSMDQELLEGEVIFEGDRLEPAFSNIPGQWGAVWISNGSIDNNINHLTIKNAEIGIYVEGNGASQASTLNINNSQIHNSTIHNLWAKSATITAENIVLGSSGNSSLYCNLGGSYDFTHATIANYWSNGFRSGRTLRIDNHNTYETNNGLDLIQANFKNSIIDGNSSSELSLTTNGENQFNYSFQNCFIKFSDLNQQLEDDELYNFQNEAYKDIIINGNPDYFDPKNYDFRVGLDSDVINQGDTSFAEQVPLDIRNIDRTVAPDLGAYQAISKEE